MRWRSVVVLSIALASSSAHAEEPTPELEVELGLAPAGLAGLRYFYPIDRAGTRFGPGLGVGTTGVLTSVALDHRFHRSRSRQWWIDWSAYASYALGWLADGTRHPLAGSADLLADGAYHWLDAGAAYRIDGGRWFAGLGFGVTVLLHAPAREGDLAAEQEDEETLWWTRPEGWIRQSGWGPTVWSMAGVRL